jgi:nucleoid-associated protein YgaU
MGLFSFLKDAGAKLFHHTTTTPTTTTTNPVYPQKVHDDNLAALNKAVHDTGIDIKDLRIDLQGDTVTAYGEAATQAEKEKVVLVLGNVEGIAVVDDRLTVAEAPEPESDFYEVKKGDSLSKIAKHYYGDALKYPVIFEANKPMLKDPNLIYPGQVLRVPKI